jgi:hypothetical protein
MFAPGAVGKQEQTATRVIQPKTGNEGSTKNTKGHEKKRLRRTNGSPGR